MHVVQQAVHQDLGLEHGTTTREIRSPYESRTEKGSDHLQE